MILRDAARASSSLLLFPPGAPKVVIHHALDPGQLLAQTRRVIDPGGLAAVAMAGYAAVGAFAAGRGHLVAFAVPDATRPAAIGASVHLSAGRLIVQCEQMQMCVDGAP